MFLKDCVSVQLMLILIICDTIGNVPDLVNYIAERQYKKKKLKLYRSKNYEINKNSDNILRYCIKGFQH